jgi:hypothetical protein
VHIAAWYQAAACSEAVCAPSSMAPQLVGKAGAVSERLQVNVGEGVGREVEHLVGW